MTPSLVDLVMLFLKERYPYWHFRTNAENAGYVYDETDWLVLIAEGDEFKLTDGGFITETVKAADPDSLARVAKHVLDVKRDQLQRRGPNQTYTRSSGDPWAR